MIVKLSTDQEPIKSLINIELETSTGKNCNCEKCLQRIYTCLFMIEKLLVIINGKQRI